MNLNQKQTVECTLYFSAFDTQTLMLTTLERYIADVRSGKHKKAVEKVQAYLAASENEKAEARRSEERRVRKDCDRTCRSRWTPYH